MPDKNRWNALGLLYAVTLVIIVALILFLSKIAHIADPTWALISAVVCTELDIGQARKVVVMRILATFLGAGVAVVSLLVMGPGYLTILISVVLITLICHYVVPVSNWRFTTATGLIVLVVGLQEQSINFAEHIAIRRALEVIAGSVIAGIVSALLGQCWAILQLRLKTCHKEK